MLQNLICSAFLAHALAADPQIASMVEASTPLTSGRRSLRRRPSSEIPAVVAGTALVVGGVSGAALGGYYFGKSNICKCTNGIEKTGDACTEHEASMCRACNPGYHLNDDGTACAANICNCPNGFEQTGDACTKHEASMCRACDPEYSLNADGTQCTAAPITAVTPNTCECRNGAEKTGAACTQNGAKMCESCNKGFNMNASQSECYGPVDIVVDLGSSKSQIDVVELKEGGKEIVRIVNLSQWYPRSWKKGKKPDKIESQEEGGLASACLTTKLIKPVCLRHMLRLKRALDNVREDITENNILSVNFLGTAGFRQAESKCNTRNGGPSGGCALHSGRATLQKLQETMEKDEFWKSIRSTYDILTGNMEATNEFIALKEVKNNAPTGHKDKTKSPGTETVGMIAIGGASLQFAVETTTAGELETGSVDGGLDVAKGKFSDAVCNVQKASDVEVDAATSGEATATLCYEAVKAKIEAEVVPFFPTGFNHFVKTDLNLYVLGGMYYSMRDFPLVPRSDDTVPIVLDVDIKHIKNMANLHCKAYKETKDTNGYLIHQCFRMNYFRNVFEKLNVPAATKIQFRKKIAGKKVEWAKATRMVTRKTDDLPEEFQNL